MPIVGAGDDALRVEPNAADQLLMAFQRAQAVAALNVPETDNLNRTWVYNNKMGNREKCFFFINSKIGR